MLQRQITLHRGPMKPREGRALCSANVGRISVLCLCPQSPEWVCVDSMGFI